MEQKNEDRFTGKAEIYNKFRPAYPKEFIDYLYSHAGFTKDGAVADIGSGTGIFSRLMLERGTIVYCVEPNDDMRETSIKDLSGFANFFPMSGSDKNTGLPDKSVDNVTAAQAAHWFDGPAFVAECRRILKPGGRVALVWNNRDYDREIVKKDYIIREKYAVGDKKGLGRLRTDKMNFIFAEGDYEYKTFANDLVLDREAYIGMNLTRSYSPMEEQDPEKYHGLVRELGELFDEYSVDGVLNFPHFTQSYVGRV